MKRYYFTHEHSKETIKLCFAYCEGKSWLWRMFFGWRMTDQGGCEFLLSAKTMKRIFEIKGY